MSKLRIDLDSEAVELDGEWQTKDELTRRLRAMLDAGDFAIARPSQALEELGRALAAMRTLAFRASPELADAVSQSATIRQVSPGALIREALTHYLGLAPSSEATAPPRTPSAAAPPSSPEPAPPLALKPAPTPEARPAADRHPPSVVVDKSALLPQHPPLELTEKKQEEEAIERRWFGG